MQPSESREKLGLSARTADPDALTDPDALRLRPRSVAVDVLRGIAACMVVVDHARLTPNLSVSTTASSFANAREVIFGQGGVGLFFVISGYLVGGPFVRALVEGRRLPDTRRYALRRAARILPAYWLALAVVALIDVGWTGASVSAPSLLVHVLLLQSLFPGEAVAIMLVAWTLTVEALYYVAVPFAAATVRRHREGALAPDLVSVCILAVGASSVLWIAASAIAFPTGEFVGTGTVFRDGLPAMLVLFCPGMLLAVAEARDDGRRNTARRLLDSVVREPVGALVAAVALLVLGVLAYGSDPLHLGQLARVPIALAAGLVLAVATRHGRWSGVPARLGKRVGEVSYGIYLWHTAAILFIGRLAFFPAISDNLVALVPATATALAVTLVPAALSWVLVESPALELAAGVAIRGTGSRASGARGRRRRRALVIGGGVAALASVVGVSAAVVGVRGASGGASSTVIAAVPDVVVHPAGAAAPAAAAAGTRASATVSVEASATLPRGTPPVATSAAAPASEAAPVCAQALALSVVGPVGRTLVAGSQLDFAVRLTNLAGAACTLDVDPVEFSVRDAAGDQVYVRCQTVCATPIAPVRIEPGASFDLPESWVAARTTCAVGRCTSAPLPAGAYALTVPSAGSLSIALQPAPAAVQTP